MATVKPPFLNSSPSAQPPPAPIPARGPSYFSSTVGTKVLMAVTGLLLAVYLVLHLAGNLLIYFGPATFNGYGYFLITNPLIIPVEIGLLAIFIIHVYKAVVNWWLNRKARPVPYYHARRRLFGYGWAGKPSRKSVASTTMVLSGPIILVFLIVHLRQFKFGPEYLTASGIRDLYRLEILNFSSALIVAFYVFCLVVIGFHLWHGLSSALNSLGADQPRYAPTLLRTGRIVAVVLAAGFITIPLWVYFLRG
ncbi:MAG: succinate dehydrogenase cytochrome b subunit [Chloroflexota bacterium]